LREIVDEKEQHFHYNSSERRAPRRRGEGLTEYFDILDCRGEKTGEVILRDEAHRKGVWHGAFHCLIIYERDGKGYALFQKRSANKKIAPEKYDVSVGGHYAAGEDGSIAGPREINEELGIEAAYAELQPLGRRVFVYCFTPGVTEYEFQDIFLLSRDTRPGALTVQREEVDGVLEIGINEGIGLFSGKHRDAAGRYYPHSRPPERVRVHADDFVPNLDNYYLKLLLLARRYMSGEREQLVI